MMIYHIYRYRRSGTLLPSKIAPELFPAAQASPQGKMLLSETQSSQYNIESLRAQQKNTSCFMLKKHPPPKTAAASASNKCFYIF
jgi:hypothetical protein